MKNVYARNVDIENEHEPDMPIPVPEGPMPSHAPSTPGRVVSEKMYEPNNSDTTKNKDHGMGQDEGDIANIFHR